MIDEKFARLRTYRNNINRYRQLLKTDLSDLEREFIERRLEEDRSAMKMLASSTFPLTFKLPEPPTELTPGARPTKRTPTARLLIRDLDGRPL